MEIGNINVITDEIKEFYPTRIFAAIRYIEDKYNLDVYHASHITTIAWGLLNSRHPHYLPKYLVMADHLNYN